MRLKTCLISFLMAGVVFLTGCGSSEPVETEPEETAAVYVDAVEVVEAAEMESEAVILEEAPVAALPDILEPDAPGIQVTENEKAVIDHSNIQDGYVMVRFTGDTEKRLKTQVKGPTTTYTYNLYKGEWAVFPLTDGNGKYQIKVFENVTGSQYSLVLATEQEVALEDEFAPFLRPN